jgi:signal transduction histidine kinase
MTTGGQDKETMEDLSVISNSTDYLDKLVKEMLDFVRIAEQGWTLKYKRVNLIEKIEFVCCNFRDIAKNKNLAFTFEHEKDEIMISADESGLIKILNNLIHNAVKYAETSSNSGLRRKILLLRSLSKTTVRKFPKTAGIKFLNPLCSIATNFPLILKVLE